MPLRGHTLLQFFEGCPRGTNTVASCQALSETFAALTGGRLAIRVAAAEAALLLRKWVAPGLALTALEADDVLGAFEESSARGVRGGAIYDYLHLVAARKARAPVLYTLNVSDFQSFHRPGDPKIAHP